MIKNGKIGVKSEKKNLSEKLKLRTEVFKEFHKKDVGRRFFINTYLAFNLDFLVKKHRKTWKKEKVEK